MQIIKVDSLLTSHNSYKQAIKYLQEKEMNVYKYSHQHLYTVWGICIVASDGERRLQTRVQKLNE